VNRCLQQAGQSKNPAIAASQREREWERLMGGDLDQSDAGFATPTANSISEHGRIVGEDSDEDEEIPLEVIS